MVVGHSLCRCFSSASASLALRTKWFVPGGEVAICYRSLVVDLEVEEDEGPDRVFYFVPRSLCKIIVLCYNFISFEGLLVIVCPWRLMKAALSGASHPSPLKKNSSQLPRGHASGRLSSSSPVVHTPRTFDTKDHMSQCIVKKDHLSKYLLKKTTSQ
jgi:hypothetical protein